MEGADINENTLGQLLTAMADGFTAERKKTEPYKELFKAGSTYTGLLRDLQHKMSSHVLDACTVFEERHGVTINHNQYHILLALPFLAKVAEKQIAQQEGTACSVDKVYFMLSEQLKQLADEATETEKNAEQV